MVTFGQKLQKSTRRFGQKVDKVANTLGRKANNTLTRVDNAIVNSDVAIRKIDHTIDRAQALGGNNVPGLGQALMAIKSARVGSKMAKDISKQTREKANELEKFNSRKYANQALQESAENGYV